MFHTTLALFSFVLSYFFLLDHCASLSHDGVILLNLRNGDWRDSSNALSNWNESQQTPCAWKGITCDEFDRVTTVDLTGHSISGNFTSAICSLPNLTALTLSDRHGYVGSHGYIAPEYANRRKVNEKSDVYSFGVVLLELVSGKKATGEAEYGDDGDVVEWIRNRILMGGQEMAVFDDRMVGDNCIEQMMRVLHLGLVCTNRVPNQRPSMRKPAAFYEKSRGEITNVRWRCAQRDI